MKLVDFYGISWTGSSGTPNTLYYWNFLNGVEGFEYLSGQTRQLSRYSALYSRRKGSRRHSPKLSVRVFAEMGMTFDNWTYIQPEREVLDYRPCPLRIQGASAGTINELSLPSRTYQTWHPWGSLAHSHLHDHMEALAIIYRVRKKQKRLTQQFVGTVVKGEGYALKP